MSAPRFLTRYQACMQGLDMAEDWAIRGYAVARMPDDCVGKMLPAGAIIEDGGIAGLTGRCRVVCMLNRRQVLLEPLPASDEEAPPAAGPARRRRWYDVTVGALARFLQWCRRRGVTRA
jgi:hypothetical protein